MTRALLIAVLLCACGRVAGPNAGADAGTDAGTVRDGGTGSDGGIPIPEVKAKAVLPATGSTGGGGTIAGRELIGFAVTDAQTAIGITPPGSSGGADVLAVTSDGSGGLRSGFVYREALRVDAVSPPVVGTSGGAKITISGAGFSASAQ